jgi:ribosomal-protein-alanine N-acetyltransferase
MPERQLEFIPGTRKVLRQLATDPEEFAAEFDVHLHEISQMVGEQSLNFLKTFPYETAPEWFGYIVVEADTRQMVGVCSFKGPRDDGRVEIAYFTFPGCEGIGIGTAMARFLMERAPSLPHVHMVVAQTAAEPNASARILEKIGMQRAGEDEEDGMPLWCWEYALPPSEPR